MLALFWRATLTHDWHDERVGCWTKLAFDKDTVTISLGRNHLAGVIVGSAFISLVLAFMSRTWFNNSDLAMLIGFLASIGPCYMSLRSQYYLRYSKYPIVLCARVETPANGTRIRFSDIRWIEVRENRGRDHVEDSAYSQVYVRLHNDSRLLIYQNHLCYKDKTRELANRVSSVVGVPVVDKL